jgi:hypothetical protein
MHDGTEWPKWLSSAWPSLSPLPPLSDDGGGTEVRVRWPKQKIACIKVEYLQLSRIKSFQ